MSHKHCSPITDVASSTESNTYCIVLNIAEGIGFDLNTSLETVLILKVSLNGVAFEVEGNISQLNVVLFNSNCIWECELEDVRRIKADNRPIKLECFIKNDIHPNECTSHVGSLLLALQRVKIINTVDQGRDVKGRQLWYKLNNLSYIYRQRTPQLHLTLMIIKKSIINHIHLEAHFDNHKPSIDVSDRPMLSNVTPTPSALQHQHGLSVKLLEDAGQILVGHDTLEDCDDVFLTTITFTQIKNILNLLRITPQSREINEKYFVFQYEVLGRICKKDIYVNQIDCCAINQKISLCFRSSLKILRVYFQQMFRIPINLYYNSEIAVAKCHCNFSQFIPDDKLYLNKKQSHDLWLKDGTCYFDISEKAATSKTMQPSVDFTFSLQLQARDANEGQCYAVMHDMMIPQELKLELEPYLIDNGGTQHLPSKFFCEVAVNTDNQFQDKETSAKKNFINDLQQQCEECTKPLIISLEAKITKCDQLLSQLENTQMQLNDLFAINLKNSSTAGNMLRELETSYKLKIEELETHIKCLTMKVQERDTEKIVLQNQRDHLEKQLGAYHRFYLSLSQLKDVLYEMRYQTDRLTAIGKFYEEQRLYFISMADKYIFKILNEKNSGDVNFSYSLEELLNQEGVAAKSNKNNSLLNWTPDHKEFV